MKKLIFIAVALFSVFILLAACGGGGGGGGGKSQYTDPGPNPDPVPIQENKVVFSDDYQIISFDLSEGFIKGVFYPAIIYPEDVEAVVFRSDRVGWVNSNAQGLLDINTGKVKIIGTANNDKGNWVLKLIGGNEAWFDIDAWKYEGKAYQIVSGLVQYGDYKPSAINFNPSSVNPGYAVCRIDFGSNLIIGFIGNRIDPTTIEKIIWNGNLGWTDSSPAWSILQIDSNGNYYAEIEIPIASDKGTLSIKLADGTFSWLDMNYNWTYGPSAIVNPSAGQIEFTL